MSCSAHRTLLPGRRTFLLALFLFAVASTPLLAALEAADEAALSLAASADTKQGYVLRQETWNGALHPGDDTPIRQQLFKNNDYHFYAWTDVKGAKVSVHVYDQDGNLVENRTWEKDSGDAHFACADVRAGYTGNFFLIVKVEQSPELSTNWQMAYAYK